MCDELEPLDLVIVPGIEECPVIEMAEQSEEPLEIVIWPGSGECPIIDMYGEEVEVTEFIVMPEASQSALLASECPPLGTSVDMSEICVGQVIEALPMEEPSPLFSPINTPPPSPEKAPPNTPIKTPSSTPSRRRKVEPTQDTEKASPTTPSRRPRLSTTPVNAAPSSSLETPPDTPVKASLSKTLIVELEKLPTPLKTPSSTSSTPSKAKPKTVKKKSPTPVKTPSFTPKTKPSKTVKTNSPTPVKTHSSTPKTKPSKAVKTSPLTPKKSKSPRRSKKRPSHLYINKINNKNTTSVDASLTTPVEVSLTSMDPPLSAPDRPLCRPSSTTPVDVTPSSTSSTPLPSTPSSPLSMASSHPKSKARRALSFRDQLTYHDSGSDEEEEPEIRKKRTDDDPDLREDATDSDLLKFTRELRLQQIEEEEIEASSVEDGPNKEQVRNRDGPDLGDFSWTDDFSTFTGQPEKYLRNPGPNCSNQDPTEIFMLIWDMTIMTYLVEQYNKYATDYLYSVAETGLNDNLMSWKETTVDELYRFLAVLNYMSIGRFDRLSDYWSKGVLGMPAFRKILPRNRFFFLLRFLHFVDNDAIPPLERSYDRKIAKIKPILDHCNSKFASLYTPQRFLSLDESLLLWKGQLSWRQTIRTKAARFGIKSYDLCEAKTGYLLRSHLYAGKESSRTDGPIDGFWNCTAKVVLDAMDGYLDVGHCVVMDNWYNQLVLTRYLKNRRTDVIGTLDRRRRDVPQQLKDIVENDVPRGKQVALHCGDISLISWKDVRLVTLISTYHNADRIRKNDVPKSEKPAVAVDYNKYMGGVDLKDQKLSAYHFERKRGMKWYMKVFRRLLNTSFLNAYIIYQKNPLERILEHREFRLSVSEGLLKRFPRFSMPIAPVFTAPEDKRFDGLHHYPDRTEEDKNPNLKRRQRLRCRQCSSKGIRSEVATICTKCNVALCLGKCYRDYHIPTAVQARSRSKHDLQPKPIQPRVNLIWT